MSLSNEQNKTDKHIGNEELSEEKQAEADAYLLKSKLRVAFWMWTFFFITWFITAFVLTKIEHQVEYDEIAEFHENWDSLKNSYDDDIFQENLEDFLDYMIKDGDCTIPREKNSNWSFAGGVYFTLNIATTIGYGNFSVVTGNGRLVTVIYSFFAIPIFMYCLSSMTTVFEHLIKKLPNYPKGLGTKQRNKRMIFRPVVFFILFMFWICVVGGFVLPVLTKQDWTPFEGMYFGYITATTIGLGDYVYDVDQSKGGVIVYVLISLALFHAFLSNLNRIINVIMLNYTVPRDPDKVAASFTSDELLVAQTAFDVVDLDENKTIDCDELKAMLKLVGLQGDAALEHKIDELMYLYDVDMSDTVDMEEWLLIVSPLMTIAGQKRQLWFEFREFWITFFTLIVSLVLGGYIMHYLEWDYEQDSKDKWKELLSSHYDVLNYTMQVSLTEMIDHLVHHKICSVPECDAYATDEPDVFECLEYHTNWDVRSATFFVFTLFTTIGYGNFTPSTPLGRLFACVYSLFGIMVTSYFLVTILDLPRILKALMFPPTKAAPPMIGGGRYGGSGEHVKVAKDGGMNDQVIGMIKQRRSISLEDSLDGAESKNESKNDDDNYFIKNSTNKNEKAISFSESVDLDDNNNNNNDDNDDNNMQLPPPKTITKKKSRKSVVWTKMVEVKNKLEKKFPRLEALDHGFGQIKSNLSNNQECDFEIIKVFFLAFSYLLILGYIFNLTFEKDWQLHNSFYFIWISCSAIGLGDFTPSDDHEDVIMVTLVIGLAYFIGMFVFMEGKLQDLARSQISQEEKITDRFGEAIDTKTDLNRSRILSKSMSDLSEEDAAIIKKKIQPGGVLVGHISNVDLEFAKQQQQQQQHQQKKTSGVQDGDIELAEFNEVESLSRILTRSESRSDNDVVSGGGSSSSRDKGIWGSRDKGGFGSGDSGGESKSQARTDNSRLTFDDASDLLFSGASSLLSSPTDMFSKTTSTMNDSFMNLPTMSSSSVSGGGSVSSNEPSSNAWNLSSGLGLEGMGVSLDMPDVTGTLYSGSTSRPMDSTERIQGLGSNI